MGTFITADTIVQDPYNPQSLNRYTYCLNNPVCYADPDGHFAFLIPLVYAVVQGAVYSAITTSVINMGVAAFTGQDVLQAGLTGLKEGAITGACTGGLGFGVGALTKVGSFGMQMSRGINTALKTTQYYNVTSNAMHGAATGDWTGLAKSAAHLGMAKWSGNPITRLSQKAGAYAARGANWIGNNVQFGWANAPSTPQIGDKVYRVWGDDAKPWGESWTTTDPSTVPNYRSSAGLPNVNTGRFVSQGRLLSTEGMEMRAALVINRGQSGGLPELKISNPESKIQLDNVSGINPEY